MGGRRDGEWQEREGRNGDGRNGEGRNGGGRTGGGHRGGLPGGEQPAPEPARGGKPPGGGQPVQEAQREGHAESRHTGGGPQLGTAEYQAGLREWSDLSEQQRSHLIRELDSELSYQRRKAALRMLQLLDGTTDPGQAADLARAISLLQGTSTAPGGRLPLV